MTESKQELDFDLELKKLLGLNTHLLEIQNRLLETCYKKGWTNYQCVYGSSVDFRIDMNQAAVMYICLMRETIEYPDLGHHFEKIKYFDIEVPSSLARSGRMLWKAL